MGWVERGKNCDIEFEIFVHPTTRFILLHRLEKKLLFSSSWAQAWYVLLHFEIVNSVKPSRTLYIYVEQTRGNGEKKNVTRQIAMNGVRARILMFEFSLHLIFAVKRKLIMSHSHAVPIHPHPVVLCLFAHVRNQAAVVPVSV